MIVPRPALILVAALTVIPLLGLAVSLPDYAPAFLGLLGLLALVVIGDAVQGRKLLRTVQVQLPDKVRWFQNRPAKFDVMFLTTLAKGFPIRAALPLPRGLESPREFLDFQLPDGAGKHFVTSECTAKERGRFVIEGCYYEIASPLRFWDIRGHQAQSMEVRVYPNLEAERKQIATIFLRNRMGGSQAVRQVGQGRDFEKLREYVPGDGYDTIHWKATARRGHPITKVFQIEKTQEVYVILDASRLSSRLQVPGDPSKGSHLDRYIAATLILGLAAEKQGDLFGLMTFDDGILNFVRARNGKEHYSACREALYRLESKSVSPDFEEVASFISMRLRRRALLIFMTDLDDPLLMESFQRAANVISKKHLVMVHMLQAGNVQPVLSNAGVASVDDIYHDLAGHLAWHDLRKMTLALKQQGVGLSLFSKEQFSAQTVSNYLRVKQRQLL